MVNGKEIRIEDGKIDLKMCPVIIKENGEAAYEKRVGNVRF